MTRFVLPWVFGLAVCGFAAAEDKPAGPKAGPSAKLVPLNKQETVLLDAANKKVVLKAHVSLQEGMLEMFLCRKNTKEHESILTFDGRAYVVHTALVAIGAEPGQPMIYRDGKYTPPTGEKLKITVKWMDKDNKPREMDAKQWVRTATRRYFVESLEALPAGVVVPKDSELRYDKKFQELAWFGTMPKAERDKLLKMSDDKAWQKAVKTIYERSQPRGMTADWVFTGSGFYVETEGPDKGKRYYKAEGGEVICVANFPSAMIDVNVESTSSGEANLLYEAWTEHIPPIDTPVTVEITPLNPKKAADSKKKE